MIYSRNDPGSGRIDTAIWLHYMDSNKTAGEEARRQLLKNAASNLEQVLAAVVSILLYGCTTWTKKKRLEKNLDGY